VQDPKKVARKIQIGINDEGLRRLNASSLSEVDKEDPAKLWKFFEDQLRVSVNFRIQRLALMQYRQQEGESLDDFVTRARTLGQQCEFKEEELQERIIELIIASTPMEPFRRELLGKGKQITLEQVVCEGRQHEAASKGTRQLEDLYKSETTVHALKQTVQGDRPSCGNCGRKHKYKECPAYKSECSYCGNMGHWKECCRKMKFDQDNQPKTKKQIRRPRHKKRMDALEQPSEDDEREDESTYISKFHAVSLSDKCLDAVTSDTAHTNLDIKLPQIPGLCQLKVKLDTGANANALPLRTFRQMYPNTSVEEVAHAHAGTKLTSYSGDDIECLGTMNFNCRYQKGKWHNTKFYIVDVPGPVILGLPTCEKLHLVAITCQRVELHQVTAITSTAELVKQFPEQFDRIGQFVQPAQILLRPDAQPHIDRPRKCSISLLPRIKTELQRMEDVGVIRRVKEHTDWCSSLVYSTKKDGSIRVCLDPKHLNDAIKRCPHKIPTLEEINPLFSGAKLFSKLDAKAGYWSVPIEEKCQILTTFRTPFGRYCFTRLPFGLNISQDIFQQRMDEMLEGCASIANDISVFGKDEEEHDRNLLALMATAKRHGLVFNSEKCAIKEKSISFFGNVYSKDGIAPDPTKVKDIHQMPTPQTKEDLQRFLGLMTYVGNFIPNLSTLAAPLRDLIKTDVPYIWEEDHQHTFEELKSSITARSVAFYDVTKPLTLEVDASMRGLGACLVQDD